MTIAGITARLDRATDAFASEAIALSHAIHAAAEVAWDEKLSARLVGDTLTRAGFTVDQRAYGVDTCVRGVAGNGSLHVVICAEYDALPGIGHGCGHNVIASASVAAAAALASVADDLDLTVTLLGTPAEEHGGGKTVLLERDAWKEAHFSLMAHPVIADDDVPCARVTMSAVSRHTVTFTGTPSHAAAAPHLAVNALDAATLTQVGAGLLRQQLPDDARVAVIVADGGSVTNVIPGRSELHMEVRSPHNDALDSLVQRVLACADGAAIATGCHASIVLAEPRYDAMKQHEALSRLWDASLIEVRGTPLADRMHFGGSTDMGNVSHVVPSIHPYIAIRAGVSALPHTTEFAALAVSSAADATVIDAARILARTVARAASDEHLRAQLIAKHAHTD